MSFDRILYFANKAANIKVGRFGNSIVELDEVLNGYMKLSRRQKERKLSLQMDVSMLFTQGI